MPYRNPPECSMENCDQPVNARGLCSKHYYRLRVNGSPEVVQERARRSCEVEDCEQLAWAQGLCSMHLTRVRRHGSTDDPRPTEVERFWSKVDKAGPTPEWNGHLGNCWLWLGSHNEQGYGLFFPKRHRPIGAHRWSYQDAVGPIPTGLHVDHLCRVPACVRPTHLEPVTVRENTVRGIEARKALLS